VLDQQTYARIVKAIPQAWIGDDTLRANVALLRRGTDAKQVVRELRPHAAIEEVKTSTGRSCGPRRHSLNPRVMRKLIGGAPTSS
jgi:hypothetical protein